MKCFKLKPGTEKILKDWGVQLQTALLTEALESLRQENCTHEVLKLFKIKNEYYVIGYMEGDDMLPAQDSEINTKHKAILKQCLGEEVELEVVYDLKL